jgi:hypothetical protein
MARRRKRDAFDGRDDDPVTPPPPMVEFDPGFVGQVNATPWVVPTPQLGEDPTAWIAAMRQAMRGGREAGRVRSRISAAARRSLRRVSV